MWKQGKHFEKKFPDRTFDVGIAEQHAVAAGLATEDISHTPLFTPHFYKEHTIKQ